MDINNPKPDYYVQLWFDETELVAAVLKDDYTAWFDLDAEIAGSNLADGNLQTSKTQLEDLLRGGYLTKDVAEEYFDTIETNNVVLAIQQYPEFLAIGFHYTGIQSQHHTTLEDIRTIARQLHIQHKGEPHA